MVAQWKVRWQLRQGRWVRVLTCSTVESTGGAKHCSGLPGGAAKSGRHLRPPQHRASRRRVAGGVRRAACGVLLAPGGVRWRQAAFRVQRVA
uniref:Uncharacterized protein n=1 Tax=Oryza brachyantha TaxID=4533 RepID=J3LW04_ORYBR